MKRGSLLVNSSPNFRLATLPFRSDAIRAYYSMCLPLLVPYYCLPDCAPTAVGWVRLRQPHRFLHQCRAILILGGPIPAR